MSATSQRVIMLASENDALKGGKIGGVGDVVRDLPKALAHLGWEVTVIVPSYGFLHRRNPSKLHSTVLFPFAGKPYTGELWEVTPKEPSEGILHLVFEHSEVRGEPIYCNDPPEQAFAQDAMKYALFCSAIGQYLIQEDDPPVIHLHDWHTATLFLLREVHPEFSGLKRIRTVYTIHNLAIQGTRPFMGTGSSVEQWFPELFENPDWVSRWQDPRYPQASYTPMLAGIQHADRVNTVSPTYAQEILRPSDHERGFYGGEGLEPALIRAKEEDRLFGILNGSEYPAGRAVPSMTFRELCELIVAESGKLKLAGDGKHDPASVRARKLADANPRLLLTCVTRVVGQKVKLFFEHGSSGKQALEEILSMLEAENGVFVVLGTGTPDYEELLTDSVKRHDRLLFFNAYSDAVARALYANGSLFLMPSSFEPCGISQMIAMRDGQPCVVHAVGGLKDTVTDGENGFNFSGRTLNEQVDGFTGAVRRAAEICLHDPKRWEEIRKNAAGTRFTWEKSAQQYIELLYT